MLRMANCQSAARKSSPTVLLIVAVLLGVGIRPYASTSPAPHAGSVDLQRSSEYVPRWRTNGTGLPGYQAGWFKLANGEKALVFVTDPRRVVRVPTTEGFTVLLSVENPEDFLASLRATVGPL